jgi:hypothetical protein
MSTGLVSAAMIEASRACASVIAGPDVISTTPVLASSGSAAMRIASSRPSTSGMQRSSTPRS